MRKSVSYIIIVKCALKAPKVTDCSAAATFQVCMHALKETATYESQFYFSGEQSDEDPN